jgi:uncharacterized membrane protein YvlD (DUF360 family)
MAKRLSDSLPAWIVGPLVLLVVIFFASSLMPDSNCNEESIEGLGKSTFIVVTALAIIAVVGAGLMRLLELWRQDLLRPGDAALCAVAFLAAVAIAKVLDGGPDGADSLLLGGILLTPAALLGLIGAALSGRRGPDSVGLLLPVYLMSAGWFYYVFAAVIVDLAEGALC